MMKNLILFLLLLAVGLNCFGQRTHPGDHKYTGDVEVEGDLINSEVQINTTATYNNSQQVTYLNEVTTGVQGYTLFIRNDTLFATVGNVTLALKADEETVPPTGAPTANSASAGGSVPDDEIDIVCSETVLSSVGTSAFTLTDQDGAVSMSSVSVSGSIITIDLAASVQTGDGITLSYTRPGLSTDIRDADGNYMLSFSNMNVTNNVGATATDIADIHYSFENNGNDDTDNGNDATTSSMVYGSSSPAQGSYYGAFTSTSREFTMPAAYDFDPTGWSISFWARNTNSGDYYYIIDPRGDNGGYEYFFLWLDGVAGDIEFRGYENSTNTLDIARTNNTIWDNSGWHHYVFTYAPDGDVEIYYDGTQETTNESTWPASSMKMDGPIRIGEEFDGDIDDWSVYSEILTQTQVTSLWNGGTAGAILSDGTGPVPDPDPDPEDVDLLWELDWADWPIQQKITLAQLEARVDNFAYSGGDGDDDEIDFVDIVDFDGDRWAKNWYWQGQCCTEGNSESAYNGGGTGMDVTAYITNSSTFYEEVYLTYEIYLSAVSGLFENSDGFKQPGLISRWGAGFDEAMALTMVTNWTYGEMDPNYYTHAWWSGYSLPPDRYNSVVKTGYDWYESDRRIVVTQRAYYGTEGNEDGFQELFFDGIFIGGQGLGSYRPGDGSYSIPFYEPGSPASGWGMVDIATFMGGGSSSYQSPKDQSLLLGRVIVWKYDDAATGYPTGSERSSSLRDISATLTELGY